MAPVAGEAHAGIKGAVLMQPADDLPGFILGTVVYEKDLAAAGYLPRLHEGLKLGSQAAGGLGQNVLLVIAGDDDIKRIFHGASLLRALLYNG
ncbi:hypothetical protein SDC9_78287 [bioreactor metagenome]|uniref:Uncharacterized protein n=1 Tax=bioreactor metagenome TaxID=1076179 RepID=A0A644YT37_9ZZZZ